IGLLYMMTGTLNLVDLAQRLPEVTDTRTIRVAFAFFTVGVVEPHLYAGFSGGVKGIAIGLAGKKTILKTHSVAYLSQSAVRAGNIATNPFQRFLWSAVAQLDRPVFSLNLVHNSRKKMVGCTVGKARPAFREAVAIARSVFSCPVKEAFDAVLVGCDHPKDESLYQSSRLFNYLLEGKRLLRRGGAIVVFAGLKGSGKSHAEKNFETVLRKKSLPTGYAFSKPGEHRAYKVLDAARSARLCLVTANPPAGMMPALTVFANQRAVCKWIEETYGEAARIGVIPAGFSFLAV
ncbi:MAG: lactate racemase domain-containing protein, partial [bacterium]|nr:lactate racemase domain-containing protein [bacterium]